MSKKDWQIWIDTGGTFTDCFALPPSGGMMRLKVLSSSVIRGQIKKILTTTEVQLDISWPVNRDIFRDFEFRIVGYAYTGKIDTVDFAKSSVHLSKVLPGGVEGATIEITSKEEVPVLAARLLTQTSLHENFPPLEMKLGSTRGTNAILERKGARLAFITTRGFKDLLEIGNQQRPDLFTVHVVKTKPLYHSVVEIDERISADGRVLKPLTQDSIQSVVRQLRNKNIDSLAIALLNSYKNPEHERLLLQALVASGFKYVSVSHELSSQIKILPRAETSVANAYLDPIIHQYVSGIQKGLSGASLKIMTSAGSLVKSDSFFPKDSLLSGPAGGVVGAAQQAGRSGIHHVIAFDMGGTSTDVSLYNNRFDYRFESRVGDFKILSPSLAIETIAAGGGSICDFDGHKLSVGPHSAGAYPGPACYGADGPLTLTDVNLLLGRLDPDNFTIPVVLAKAEEAFASLLQKIKKITGRKPTEESVLESLIQIANEKMAEAIKKISVQQGFDPRDFSLLSFGGAGGQHACALAEILGMERVLVPYDAGLLSAYGIGHASTEKFAEKLMLSTWSAVEKDFSKVLHELFENAKEKFRAEGYDDGQVVRKKSLVFLRFAGQDSSLEIEYVEGVSVPETFRKKYHSIFGHWLDRELEVESVKVIASIESAGFEESSIAENRYTPQAEKSHTMIFRGRRKKVNIYRWEKLKPGATISGPSLVISGNSTTFVDDHWRWSLDRVNNGHLVKQKSLAKASHHAEEAQLELFTNRFTALAQEMGALLQRTSFSVNVKERLDFSCAVLDPEGYLVVNAPHIPVHLGSMGVCVREVAKAIRMEEGDVIITNHPAFGGSHLPDVTLIKPVFFKRQLVGYVANRAHHAEIGGKKPGSMPADATTLEEEGVIIAPTWLIKKGEHQWHHIREILLTAKFPTRTVEENLADLNGALAAVNLGEKGLQELCSQHGSKIVIRQMKALRNYASALLVKKIVTLKKQKYSALERLDDGSKLKVTIMRKGKKLKIDFTGSSPVHAGNLNATKAIVQSVVLYSLRLLVNVPLPMNEGLMEPIDLVLPAGLLNPNFALQKPPAVVGGNTEVSQRLTDTMIKAFGLAACSQGTMNNFLFGNERFGYYETICGGTGAAPGFHGASAVHQHMTNTRITDPELMEFRYPVTLERFEIRKGSGGKGKWRGGDGIERELRFNDNLEVSILSQHRREKPFGMNGGGPGKTGEQILICRDGKKVKLKGMDGTSVNSGDRIIIKTPGGGSWGR